MAHIALVIVAATSACTLDDANVSDLDSLPADIFEELQDEDKLYGGDTQIDTQNQFPGVVSVYGGCSATIVSPRHAITAAHCIRQDGAQYGVSSEAYGMRIGVGVGVRHPLFKDDDRYDIAILTFPDDPEITRHFAELMIPIDLSQPLTYAGRTVTYVGFGLDEHHRLTAIRKFGTSKANSCLFGSRPDLAWGPVMCDYIGRDDTAHFFGDSGGATLTQNASGNYVLSGVMASGIDYSGVEEGVERAFSHANLNTQISKVRDFIMSTAPEIFEAAEQHQ